jgi:hypothetical protein
MPAVKRHKSATAGRNPKAEGREPKEIRIRAPPRAARGRIDAYGRSFRFNPVIQLSYEGIVQTTPVL